MTQFELNKEIEAFVEKTGNDKNSYTSDDLDYIRQYTGSGGRANMAHMAKVYCTNFIPPIIFATSCISKPSRLDVTMEEYGNRMW